MPKQGVHPFGKKPLPKGRVEWAINETKSLMAAARLLQVSYNTPPDGNLPNPLTASRFNESKVALLPRPPF